METKPSNFPLPTAALEHAGQIHSQTFKQAATADLTRAFFTMSFDKTKVMRNAERFLSQGKIRAAIAEYKRIVENDPKDFSTLNILGDLHIKNSDKAEGVDCFTQVAEHYSRQGFSQKAIAIYNKISRLQPGSMEVSAKLAQLYQSKGSVAEARAHYNALAENYQRKGQKYEALSVWKQIAELDPNNTEIYLKIADACWQEEQFDEAAESFTEAGLRFLDQKKYEAALSAFQKSLEVKKNYLRALNGLIQAQIGAGYSDEAARTLENILKEQPFNRDILYLLADCYIDMNAPADAERAIVNLVEQEPANYPKFLELVKLYLKNNDLDSAARILSLSAEHLLVGGQAEDFLNWTNEILAQNPEQIEALRLLVRYHGWQRDANALKASLERLAETAHAVGAVEDEGYALSQLVMIAPQEADFARRLHELNAAHGIENAAVQLEAEAETESAPVEIPQFENFADDDENDAGGYGEYDFSGDSLDDSAQAASGENDLESAAKQFDFYDADGAQPEAANEVFEAANLRLVPGETTLSDELKLQREIESVEFYIAQGYTDLARKSLLELESEFGSRDEFAGLHLKMDDSFGAMQAEEKRSKEKEIEGSEPPKTAAHFETLDELKAEFDASETVVESGDYETHYHLAIAYREMGLMEDSIREFQNALTFVRIDDGTRRFFQCSNLLGHCFVEKQMPNLALMWFQRSLETPDLNAEERLALYYEVASAYESGGELEKALEYFERLYAEDVDFRGVSQRLDRLRENLRAM